MQCTTWLAWPLRPPGSTPFGRAEIRVVTVPSASGNALDVELTALAVAVAVAVGVAAFVLVSGPFGVWPNVLTRVLLCWRTGPAPKLETIWFVVGPLAGRTDHLQAGPDGLPPYQFCALVVRSTLDGGDYTLPYQRGLICEKQHAWHYTQGWTQ